MLANGEELKKNNALEPRAMNNDESKHLFSSIQSNT